MDLDANANSSLRIRNVTCNIIQLPRHRCRNNVPNAIHNAHVWLMK